MNKKLLVLIIAFALLLGGAVILYTGLADDYAMDSLTQETPPPQNSDEEHTLHMAPDITIYDAEGSAVQLSDYAGKPLVLNFWTSWCGPCQMEMPHFQAKYEELGNDVQFMMVNITNSGRETEADAKQFIADAGYTFPVFYDLDSDAMQTYSVYSFPTTYFLNAEGYLVAQATGAISAETLQKGIDMVK